MTNKIHSFYIPLILLVVILSTQAVALASETWHYELDDVGNIKSRGLDPLPANATHNYGYDELYRLTDESNPSHTDQYDYDANGNRTGFSRDGNGITLQIDPTSN
ncbi:MAG: hypothetical protein GY820_42800, partial [Gammaproteobacteria bacterium]|nr:hypothetical protein [Gammaproteobacteria bacterium]